MKQIALLAGIALATTGADAGMQFKANGGPAVSIGAFDFSDGSNAAFSTNASDRFSHAVLGAIHTELTGFDDTLGNDIETDGKLTFVVGQTSEGLAMFALFDQETGGQSNRNIARSAFSYTGSGTGYQNEGGELGSDNAGTFAWWANGRGDAFAVTGVSSDFADNVFSISDFTGELSGALDVQVLSLQADGSVEVISLFEFFGDEGSSPGNFSFANVIPMPAASALAGVGLLGVGIRRRR